ncbi:MAG: phosphoglycerate mutase family protein, partial [Propionibacteriaceae bacterium]|nr:phosphoglycerate mutase family protein [Propionibacteriaceae bacterium]
LAWAEGRPYGTEDPPLSPLGHTQAARLAEAFADGRLPKPDYLLSSLMQRALATVAPLSEVLDRPVLGVAEAHEVGGVYRRTEADAVVAYPGEGRAALAGLCPRLLLPSTVTDDGWYFHDIETRAEGWARANQLAGALLDQFGDGDNLVALVAHGLFGQLLLRAYMGWEPDLGDPWPDTWLRLNNTATALLTVPGDYGERALVHWINRTDHLTPDLLSE